MIYDSVYIKLFVLLTICIAILHSVGVLDRVDRLIFSLGLGSGGYDYSPINEPAPTSPSNTTRRRRQSQEHRCPANGKNGEICLDPPQGLVIHNLFLR